MEEICQNRRRAPPVKVLIQVYPAPLRPPQQKGGGWFGGLFHGHGKPPEQATPAPHVSEPPSGLQTSSLNVSEPQPPPTPSEPAAPAAEPPRDNTQYVPTEEKVTRGIEETTQGDPGKRAELLTRAAILHPLLESADRFGMSEEEVSTIRKYARAAGERARSEVEARAEESPIATIDQILLDLRNELGEHRNEVREDLFSGSWGLHNFQSRLQEAVNMYQQRRDIEGESVTFDEAFDAVNKDQRGEDRQEYFIGLGRPTLDVLEPMLKKIGVLKPEQTVALLKGSSKWMEHRREALLGDRAESNIVGGTFDSYDGALKYLDTSIPGLSVGIAETGDFVTNFGRKYGVVARFDRETARQIAKSPQTPSPLYTPPNS